MLVTWAFGFNYADAMVTTMSTAIVLLSVVVVTGYAGQISLCQFAMAGLGTFIAGRLATAAHLPLLLAVLIAIVVALLAGVVIGIPALRSRGREPGRAHARFRGGPPGGRLLQQHVW